MSTVNINSTGIKTKPLRVRAWKERRGWNLVVDGFVHIVTDGILNGDALKIVDAGVFGLVNSVADAF